MRALEWAVVFARKLSAPLHIFHRIESPGYLEKDVKRLSESQMAEYVREVGEKLKAIAELELLAGLEVSTSLSGGDFIGQIEQLQSLNSFDFIVMGARGQHMEADKPMGSHAVKAVRKLGAHILIVPEAAQPEEKIREVLFASALNESDRPALKWFIRLMALFGTEEMHVMSVNTGSYFTQPTFLMEEALEEFARLARSLETGVRVETHFYKDNSVLDGIMAFGKEERVNLIAVPNHEKHPLKRIFLGSTVEALVQVSDAPVLCIDLH